MNAFEIIYKILSSLADAMDQEEIDTSILSPAALGISGIKQYRIVMMLIEMEYVEFGAMSPGDEPYSVKLERPGITLKGLAYLATHPAMVTITEKKLALDRKSQEPADGEWFTPFGGDPTWIPYRRK